VLFSDPEQDFQLDLTQLVLGFNSSERQQCFDVAITDDKMFETDEPERIVLQLLLMVGSPLGVSMAENASRVDILVLDDDMATTATTQPELTTTQQETTVPPLEITTPSLETTMPLPDTTTPLPETTTPLLETTTSTPGMPIPTTPPPSKMTEVIVGWSLGVIFAYWIKIAGFKSSQRIIVQMFLVRTL
jgi:hypothetical protein